MRWASLLVAVGCAVPPPGVLAPSTAASWPMPSRPDPPVLAMPADAQTSIESVGEYLAKRFTDRRELVKALHDYVLLRLHYDDASAVERVLNSDPVLRSELAPQDARSVFARRTAVCEGYARLLAALGHAAGVDMTVVVGETYSDDGEWLGGHAWNLAHVDGRWLPIDATWDDTEPPSSEYLLTPDDLFRTTHEALFELPTSTSTAIAAANADAELAASAVETRKFMAWFEGNARSAKKPTR